MFQQSSFEFQSTVLLYKATLFQSFPSKWPEIGQRGYKVAKWTAIEDKENSIECRAKETKWPAYRETLGGLYRRVSTTDNERALGEFCSGRFIGLSFVSGPLLSTHISLFIIIHAGRSRCIVNVTRDHARLCVLYVCNSSSSNT